MVLHLLSTLACLWFAHAADESYSIPISFEEGDDDDSCTLLPGQCDDNSKPGFVARSPRNQTQLDKDLEDVYSRVGGTFYCYTTSDGSFLAYDPPNPDTSKVINKQLPKTIKDLQESWMASSFEFGMPCKAMGAPIDCPKGFVIDHAGIGVVNDAGNQYGGGSKSAPPRCGGCQEEVVVCLSSARSVRKASHGQGDACSSKQLTPPSSSVIGRQERFLKKNLTAPQVGCALATYKNPWIIRNRNQFSHNMPSQYGFVNHGTGKYFYLVTIQGFPCRDGSKNARDGKKILSLIKGFAQGFQGIIDVWRAKPACDGKCMMMSGAVSAWMTYSIPVAVSVLAQLRAWASLKVDDIKGCKGNQAVLKFASVSVSDGGVPCCPEPHSGGRCNQNYNLPEGWETHLTQGTDLEFATWLATKLGDGVGQCEPGKGKSGCMDGAPTETAGMCPGANFSYKDPKCKAYDYTNYIPLSPAPPAPPTTPSPAPGPAPSPSGPNNTIIYIAVGVSVTVLLCGIVFLCVTRKRTVVADMDGSSLHPLPAA